MTRPTDPTSSSSLSARVLIAAFGVLSYLLFFACFLYSIAFLGNLDGAPKTIDSGEAGPLLRAVAIDLGLLSLFAIQHSGMARPGFKRFWTRIVPPSAERSVYVLLSTLCMAVILGLWQPIPTPIWQVTQPVVASLITGLYFFGWGLLLYATTLIDHFDLFGLRQVWLALRGRPYVDHPFATPGLYRVIRHPIYVAWAVIFWATPVMSVGHLLFSVVTTLYMPLAVLLEERDLVEHFGEDYRRYQRTTPRYVPRLHAT